VQKWGLEKLSETVLLGEHNIENYRKKKQKKKHEHRANLSFVVLLLLPNQKNERVLQPISGSERPDSQANSARKAGWSFNCPTLNP
jgi:hypothetical protein